MRGELVAVDLETTGFDPQADKIIEIGAVRMIDGEIVDEFSTLVNPNKDIPPVVSNLTGIWREDVIDAPVIQAVLPKLKAFVGNAPWMAHNISFDAGFLYHLGILQNNLRIDTYELASVLLPRAPRYTLTALTSGFDIDIESAHRALYDARATARLYWQLWKKLLDLPVAQVKEIFDLASDLAWDGRLVFGAALEERRNERIPPPTPVTTLFDGAAPDGKPLRPNDDTNAMNVGRLKSILSAGGELAESIAGYEERAPQIDMAVRIAEAFNESRHLMVEAGTGTGKSVAYLVPAMLWAAQNNERVVISTNTINLQEQLLSKDIPALQAALKLPISAVVLKGRNNYLCPRRLAAARRRKPTSIDELRMIAKILVWLNESQTGDKGEISLRGNEEFNTWNRLSAEDEGCTSDRCAAMVEGKCPFYKARKAAESAHMVIVNHALLVSDAMTENRVIPDYRYLIVDEAHHLEDATTSGLSFRVDEGILRRRLADLGNTRRGLLGNILSAVKAGAPEKDARKIESGINVISEAVAAADVHIANLFGAVRALMSELVPQQSDFTTQVRVLDNVRSKHSFMHVQAAWGTLGEFFEAISDAMHRLKMALGKLENYAIADLGDLVSSAESASRYLTETQTQLAQFFTNPSSNMVYWLSTGQDQDYVALQSAPLHVGSLIEKHVLSTKHSVILTSATLQTNRSFDFLKRRLGAENIDAVEVGSPFNYKDSTLIFVPTDMPDPNDRGKYQQAVERGLIELAAALNGRMMALFTSYTQLRQTAQAVTPRLALGNIAVFDQSDGSSRQALLEGFKNAPRAVLLATRSFWEGVDIPGEALSALVIVRLPFTVPTDPVFAARTETYTDSFNEYTLPDAILRFRQGFGRLIRTSTDRGVVAVFDNRVLTKSYGANFIESLPDANVQYAPLESLPTAAVAWLKARNSDENTTPH